MEVLQLSVSMRKLSSSRSAKLRSRNIDNSRKRTGNLRLRSSSTSAKLPSRSIDNSSRRIVNLCLSSSNDRRRIGNLCLSCSHYRRRGPGNLFIEMSFLTVFGQNGIQNTSLLCLCCQK
jgi:hypothetical protein